VKVPTTKSKKLAKAAMHKFVHSVRGSIKRKPGEKPFAEAWADYKRAEIELEERKLQRFGH
jgi:hypothetical protein